MSWEMRPRAILLVAAGEIFRVEEYKGSIFSMIPFVYLETQRIETPTIIFRTECTSKIYCPSRITFLRLEQTAGNHTDNTGSTDPWRIISEGLKQITDRDNIRVCESARRVGCPWFISRKAGQIAFNGTAHSGQSKSSGKVDVISKQAFWCIHRSIFESYFFYNLYIAFKSFSLHNQNILNNGNDYKLRA
jgi:hypothetical protein